MVLIPPGCWVIMELISMKRTASPESGASYLLIHLILPLENYGGGEGVKAEFLPKKKLLLYH